MGEIAEESGERKKKLWHKHHQQASMVERSCPRKQCSIIRFKLTVWNLLITFVVAVVVYTLVWFIGNYSGLKTLVFLVVIVVLLLLIS